MNRSPYTFIGIFVILSLLLVVVQARIFDAVLYFLFAGIVPGTNYALPPLVMLLLFLAVGWVMLLHVSSILSAEAKLAQEAHKIIERTQRFPRRRYQRS